MQIESIPTWLANEWNIATATAQVILSTIVILSVLLPVMYLSRNKRGWTIELALFFLTESALVGIGWLPFWILIATVCLMAYAVASVGADAITGG